mmetsp:Transcript_157507/g.277874  ORF Transcript_157507/g.277874 Transcript_157507/m.277874 type:complete len:211 (-) Transcript_157507:478-1110(-)
MLSLSAVIAFCTCSATLGFCSGGTSTAATGSHVASSPGSVQVTSVGDPEAIQPQDSHRKPPPGFGSSGASACWPFTITLSPDTRIKWLRSGQRQNPCKALRSSELPGGRTGRAKPEDRLRCVRCSTSISYWTPSMSTTTRLPDSSAAFIRESIDGGYSNQPPSVSQRHRGCTCPCNSASSASSDNSSTAASTRFRLRLHQRNNETQALLQ